MNNQQIFNEFYAITGVTSAEASNEYLMNGLNAIRGKIVLDTLQVTGDHNFQEKFIKVDLVNADNLTIGGDGQAPLGYNGEYPFESDLIRPVRVEITTDGTNYTPAKFYDMNQNPGSEVVPNITTPHVMFERDSFFVRPVPKADITGGMCIWYEYRQADFAATDLTKSPETEPNTHLEYAYELAIRWGMKPNNKVERDWRAELKELRKTRRKFYLNRFKKQNKVTSVYNMMRFR